MECVHSQCDTEDDKLSVRLEVKRLIKYGETQWTRLS